MKSTIPLKMYVEAYISSLPADADAAADADALAQALEAIKPLRSFVGDASMSAPERRKALETALPRVQDATRNLAIVLANDGRIKDVNRLPALVRSVQAERDGKRHAILAVKQLNFDVIAMGDSYNDTTMLCEAERGILFRPPENVRQEFPQFPVALDYEEVKRLICDFASGR